MQDMLCAIYLDSFVFTLAQGSWARKSALWVPPVTRMAGFAWALHPARVYEARRGGLLTLAITCIVS